MILRPFALVGFSLALTLLAINLADGSVFVFAAAAVCILLLCVFLKPIKKRGVYAVAMMSVILACASYTCAQEYRYKPAVKLVGENAAVCAVVASNPTYSESRWSTVLKVISIDGTAADCKMFVYSDEEILAEPYDQIEFTAEVFSIEDIDSDLRNYYKSKNIFLLCYGLGDIKATPCGQKPIGYYLLKANAYLCARLKAMLSAEASPLAVGMLTGNKSDIPRYTQRQFAKSGLSHVLAVSGLHMSILIMSLYKLLRELFGRFRRLPAAVCIAAAILYAGVTGFSPSALRSCITLGVMLGGKLISRRADALNSLGFAAFLIAIINPFAVTDWSFMLSFSATLGIVLLNRHISSFSARICSGIKLPQLSAALRALLDSVGISLVATVFCLPVSVFFVGSVSTVFLPANLMTLCAVPVVLVSALITAVLPFPFCRPSAEICEMFCRFIEWVVRVLSGIEYASISTDSSLIKGSLLAVCLIILLAFLLIKNRKVLIKVSAFTFAFAVVLNICFGAVMNYKQVSIAASENSVVVYRGSTAVVLAYGYYGCYQASSILYELNLDNVFLILPGLEEDSSMYMAEEIFENYNVKKLVLTQKHDYRFLADSYEITDNTAVEFGGMIFEFRGDCCRVVSDSGVTVIPLENTAPELQADFIVACKALPEWVNRNDYVAVINGKNTEKFALLKYNGFGRYEIKGG